MKNWELSIGLYPGVLIGARSYVEQDYVQHVVYLPFIGVTI